MMLTPEEINYIVEWYESGNEPRDEGIPERLDALALVDWIPRPPGENWTGKLGESGNIIARQAIQIRKLREALEIAIYADPSRNVMGLDWHEIVEELLK
jgi:hypothetical protein